MAEWKKVLVSGSDIEVAAITASNVPGGDSDDKVLVLSSDGSFKQVAQGLIQGNTEATFTIAGNSGNELFDATGDTLNIVGSNGITTTVTDNGAITSVKVALPDGTISGSNQVTISETLGYTAFSQSLADDISDNASAIAVNAVDIANIKDDIIDLVATSSQLVDASASIASFIGTANTNISSLQTSITALNTFTGSVITNDQTGSFLISESVVGTENEIVVTANGAQGIQIGLPTDVTIGGRLEAGRLLLQGVNQVEAAASIISGSTINGNNIDNTHQFTGSVNITGSFNFAEGDNLITISTLGTDNTANVGDIVVRSSVTGQLYKAGTAIAQQISGAFNDISASLAQDIANLNTDAITTNTADITALQEISQSLLDSASAGIHLYDGTNGNSITLGQTASFVASGDGLSVDLTPDAGEGTTGITYTINPTTLGAAIGAFSQSAQLQNILDDIYVNYSEGPISGAAQLQTLGFITSSDFGQLDGVPVGLISGALEGDAQGQIKINNVNVDINGLGSDDSPTFNNLVVSNNLTVKGATTSLNTTELNIEDQFLLINSGAGAQTGDKDGGIIVDSGNGSGALLAYSNARQAWGFSGATDPANGVAYDTIASTNTVDLDVIVATVSQSANGVGVAPSGAPLYGFDTYKKGQMHINTDDSTIWIYV